MTRVLAVGPLVVAGAYAAAVARLAAASAAAGHGLRGLAAEPLRRAALALVQQRLATERPDAASRALAPAVVAALAAVGLALVPLSRGWVVVDAGAGIVVWGSLEALAIAAVYLHGWSANSLQPLVAAYRFTAAGLTLLLLSMFVLIGVALPAQSLRLADVVDAQAGLWNVVRQPLGLPLFLVVALGITSWPPLDLAGGADLAGGTAAEASGPGRLAWTAARAALLAAFAAMGAAAFLGGWHGPWLPGPAWMAVKTAALLAVLAAAGVRLAGLRAEALVARGWTVLLPLAFADLALAGLVAQL